MDDAAYLAMLAAAPEDDAIRLAWADALQARGEPRGDLIAFQVAQARATGDEAEALADAAEEPLADHEDALTPAGLAAAVAPQRITFRRGFVEGLELDAQQLIACADELHATTPVLDLALESLSAEEAAQLAVLPHLARIRRLEIMGDDISDAAISTLLGSPHLHGLRELVLPSHWHPDVVTLLQRSQALGGLEALHVHLDATQLRDLLQSSALPRLHKLRLDHDGSNEGDLDPIALPHRRERWTSLSVQSVRGGESRDSLDRLIARAGVVLPALRSLEVVYRGLEGRGVRRLIAAELPALRHLDVSHGGLSLEDVVELLASPLARGLEAINLRGVDLGDTSAGPALAGVTLPALRTLDLSATRMDAGAARALATWSVPELESLTLTETRIGDRGAAALASAPGLGRLRHLDLEKARVAAVGARALGDGHLPALRELLLHGVKLDEAAVAALGASPGLPRLRSLRLGGLHTDGALLTSLLRAPLLARLVTFECSQSKLDDAAIAAIADNPDARRLRHLRLAVNRGLTGASLLAIAGSPHLTRLRELEAWFSLTDADMQVLVEAPGLRCLRRLKLSARDGGAESRQRLTTRFGRNLKWR